MQCTHDVQPPEELVSRDQAERTETSSPIVGWTRSSAWVVVKWGA